ncbi:GtrA family protein [Sinomonas mesophila]|uniref:GtrA family protein n=1 Tax=Sinomonas mesophila TaxID=1531955 RepID=UPI0009856349
MAGHERLELVDQQRTLTEAPTGPELQAPDRRGLSASPGGVVRWRAWSLWRVPLVRQLTRFAGVGVVCTAASLALYALCRPWLGAQAANAVALVLTSVMNTGLNRRFTFKVRGPGRLAQDHLHGLLALAVALALTAGSLAALHWLVPEADVAQELWTTTIAGWAATVVRFVLLRNWVFRRARDA